MHTARFRFLSVCTNNSQTTMTTLYLVLGQFQTPADVKPTADRAAAEAEYAHRAGTRVRVQLIEFTDGNYSRTCTVLRDSWQPDTVLSAADYWDGDNAASE
jgi:hypothetical protein